MMPYLVPRKKPLSSCVPAIIEHNGELELVIGGSGGTRILSSVLQVYNKVLNNWKFFFFYLTNIF